MMKKMTKKMDNDIQIDNDIQMTKKLMTKKTLQPCLSIDDGEISQTSPMEMMGLFVIQ